MIGVPEDPSSGRRPRRAAARSADDPVRLGDALGTVADRLGAGRADVIGLVFSRWEELVGPVVAAHVRPLRIDAQTLIVAVDHPAWSTQLRHLAPQILGKIADVCGEHGAPARLDVRVRR